MNEHVEEAAELYALGLLSDGERIALDAHVANCGPCSARIAAASSVVEILCDGSVEQRLAPPELAGRVVRSAAAQRELVAPPWSGIRVIAGLAAALVLALGLSLAQVSHQNHDLRVAIDGDERAFSTLTHSHFRHVEFSKLAAAAPSAKVLYARDGAWFYVVIDAARSDLHVIGEANGTRTDYGLAAAHGHTATLFVASAQHATKLELRDVSGLVGVATPQY